MSRLARRSPPSPRVAIGAAIALGSAIILGAAASAQTLDVERGRTFVAGTPPGARADRVNGARTGLTHDPLPAGSLRVAWRTPIGTIVDSAPVVDGHGTSYVVTNRGEVVAVGRDGAELWRVSTSAPQPGPLALLSDDTLVFVDRVGEAFAVKSGALRWRQPFGRSDVARLAPLPLADGGVVVATAHDLASLDVDGHQRGRVTFTEALQGPLVAARGQVVVVAQSGAVWTWVPGAIEATHVGSFVEAPTGGAAASDDHTLLAVTAGGSHVTAVDLVRGTASTVASAPLGVWIGSPAVGGATTYVELLSTTGQLLVGLDASGAEVARVPLAARTATIAADGGVGIVVAVPIASPLVDASGAVAFATVEGGVGMAVGTAVTAIADACGGLGRARADEAIVSGLAPLGPGAFVASCHSGTLLAIEGRMAAGASGTYSEPRKVDR